MDKKVYKVTDIKWDLSGDGLTKAEQSEILEALPKEVQVTISNNDVEDLDDDNEIDFYISEYLSDTYGYCHEGYTYTEIE